MLSFRASLNLTSASIILMLACVSVHAQNVGSYGKMPRTDTQGSVDLPVKRKLGQPIPLDVTFYDHDAKDIKLSKLIAGKPTILVPAYYRCQMMCNTVLNDLTDALRKLRRIDSRYSAGDAFNVVVFSIDAREQPDLARPKREFYLKDYDGRDPSIPGWWFLTATHGQFNDVNASKAEIRKLTNALGYPFVVKDQKPTLDEQGRRCYVNEWGETKVLEGSGFSLTGKGEKDYRHTRAIVILTPDGRISQYHMGVSYDPGVLRDMIDLAQRGEIASEDEKVALTCVNVDRPSDFYKKAMRILAYVAAPVGIIVLLIGGYTVMKSYVETPVRIADQQTETMLAGTEPAATGSDVDQNNGTR